MKKILRLPFYPFLFAIYPVLSLLAHNVTQVNGAAGVRSMLVACIGAGCLLVVFRLIYHSWHRAAFIVAACMLLFFTYGQVYDVIHSKWKTARLTPWMAGIWGLLFLLVLVVAALHKVHFDTASLTLNFVTVGLVVYSAVLLAQWSFRKVAAPASALSGPDPVLNIPPGETLPDIYYIMPEDYGRADLLQQMDQIDISQFMQYLKDTGFYVAECSQSNYATSELSLGSSLNMEYLQDLGPKFTADNIDQGPIWNAIRFNALSSDLKKAGYTTVAFATGFAWSELDNADVFLRPALLWSDMTSFETLVLRTTPFRYLEDKGVLNLDEIDGQRYRERTLLAFNSASTLVRMPGPKFVFMHIISPHEPFVFGPDGQPIDPAPFMDKNQLYTQAEYTRGYREQVPFVNMMLERTITTLVTKSSRPLVIILQTDTAPLFTTGPDTFKILNAYYMPGHTTQLYPGISPVNTFRLVLDTYFGADLSLLEDTSYYSPIPRIYDFSTVPNPCSAR